MKKMMLIATLLLICGQVHAGPIAEVFGESVFGVTWGAMIEDVAAQHPGGKLSEDFGYVQYKIEDGREVLKTARKESNQIVYSFNSQKRLSNIGVEFPNSGAESFGDLLNKLTTYFGEAESNNSAQGSVSIVWPADQGIRIALAMIPSGLFGFTNLLSIEKTAEPTATSKKDLGF